MCIVTVNAAFCIAGKIKGKKSSFAALHLKRDSLSRLPQLKWRHVFTTSLQTRIILRILKELRRDWFPSEQEAKLLFTWINREFVPCSESSFITSNPRIATLVNNLNYNGALETAAEVKVINIQIVCRLQTTNFATLGMFLHTIIHS